MNLNVHQDHPGGFTVTFQGPLLGGADSRLFIFDEAGAPDRHERSLQLAETIEMREGSACCFDADLFHSTAPVVQGMQQRVWVAPGQAQVRARGAVQRGKRGRAGPSYLTDTDV